MMQQARLRLTDLRRLLDRAEAVLTTDRELPAIPLARLLLAIDHAAVKVERCLAPLEVKPDGR